ncbi:hypothetical protein [Sutcliffiella deserti]|uniref:hypothetical protein n=1 Tax=Sutcliffiella deserti TaxID=2875501 RepID=UPI001CBBB8DB|nr:hypothetical protein [Sutcliffiella deserti]
MFKYIKSHKLAMSINLLLLFIVGLVGYHFFDFVEDGSLFSSTTLASVQEIEHKEYEESILYQDGREVTALETLTIQHSYLNDITGWGGVETVNLRNLITSDEWKELKVSVNWMKEEGFAPSKILNDMENAHGLILLVERNGDRTALRYLHRIFHDLDVHLNEVKEDKGETNIWGVTHALGNNREIRRINNYLKKHF